MADKKLNVLVLSIIRIWRKDFVLTDFGFERGSDLGGRQVVSYFAGDPGPVLMN